jgi:hypothetical protein
LWYDAKYEIDVICPFVLFEFKKMQALAGLIQLAQLIHLLQQRLI